MSKKQHSSKLIKEKALGYLRYSDKKQSKGETLITQKEVIQKYATANYIEVVKWFTDEAKSGKNTERDGLQDLLKTAVKMKGQIDYVIVYKMNRASRDLESYIIRVRVVLEARGIKVRSATEYFDDSPLGDFTEKLYVLLGQLDNDTKAENVKDNMSRMAKQGYWMHKPIRGYRAIKIKNSDNQDRSTMEPNAESEKVVKVLLRFNRGDTTIAELCRYATSVGLLSLKGKPISQESMTGIIKKPEYAGYVHDKFTNYELVKGKHKGLIAQEVYWQNQDIMKRKNKAYLLGLKHHKINTMVPLRSFMRCSWCNKSMTSANPGGKQRYYCPRKPCRGTGSIQADIAHDKFERVLSYIEPRSGTLKLMKEVLVRTSVKKLGSVNQDLADLRDRLNSLANTRANTIKMYVNGQISTEDKQALIDDLDIEKLDISDQIDKLEQQQTVKEADIEYALNFMANVAKQWSDASLELKQKFQNAIFPKGFVYDVKNENFIIHEISPLYRCAELAQEAHSNKNSFMVTHLDSKWNNLFDDITLWLHRTRRPEGLVSSQ